MKTETRYLTWLAFAAAVPLALCAQSGSSSSTDSSTANPATPSSSSATTPGTSSGTYSTRSTEGTGSSASSSRSTSSPSSSSDLPGSSMHAATTGSSMGTMGIRAVSADNVDRQLTAKALIGKDVYDSSNKKIGEVRDVVLDSSRAPQLATSLSMRSRSHRDTSSGLSGTSAAGSSNSMDATAPGSSRATASGGSMTGTSTGGAGTDRVGSSELESLGGTAMSEPAAIISYGGFMGAGATLFRVPLSQLRYDSASDHLALNVTDRELSSLKNSNTSRGAAE